MTSQEKFDTLNDAFIRTLPRGLRIGQSLMICLSEVDRDLYERICTTKLDCFYMDEIFLNTIQYIISEWGL